MDTSRIPATTKRLSLILFVTFLGFRSSWHFLPVFFEQQLENFFLVGLLTSLPSLVTIMTDIPVGNLVQRAGERIVIIMATIVQVTPAICYLLSVPIALIGGKLLEGLSKSLLWNSSWSLSMKTADEETESTNLAIFMLGPNTAELIGPIIGGWLIMTWTFDVAFVFWIAIGLCSIPLAIWLLGTDTKKPLGSAITDLGRRQTYMDEWQDLQQYGGAIIIPLLYVFLYSIVFSFFWMVIPLILDELGTSFLIMGLILGAAAIPKLFQFVFGELADRYGNEQLILTLNIVLIPLLLLMAYAETIIAMAGLFFVARIAVAGVQPAVHSLFDEHAPDHVESELTGFLELSKHSGQAIGPVMAGAVASMFSLSASFFAAAGVTGIIIGLALLRLTGQEPFKM